MKMEQAISGTSAATFKVMELRCNFICHFIVVGPDSAVLYVKQLQVYSFGFTGIG